MCTSFCWRTRMALCPGGIEVDMATTNCNVHSLSPVCAFCCISFPITVCPHLLSSLLCLRCNEGRKCPLRNGLTKKAFWNHTKIWVSLFGLKRKKSYWSGSITVLLFHMLCIFPKMSDSFADCQDFIQLQEQEFFRLKLQHALDLKVELIKYREGLRLIHHIHSLYMCVNICPRLV